MLGRGEQVSLLGPQHILRDLYYRFCDTGEQEGQGDTGQDIDGKVVGLIEGARVAWTRRSRMPQANVAKPGRAKGQKAGCGADCRIA